MQYRGEVTKVENDMNESLNDRLRVSATVRPMAPDGERTTGRAIYVDFNVPESEARQYHVGRQVAVRIYLV